MIAENFRESNSTIQNSVTTLLAEQRISRDALNGECQNIRDQVSRLKRDIQKLACSTAATTGKTLALSVATKLETTLTPVLQNSVTEGLLKVEATHPAPQEVIYRSHPPAAGKISEYVDSSSAISEKPGKRDILTRKRRLILRESIYKKTISTIFGYVSIYYDMLYQDQTLHGLHNEEYMLELRIIIIPRPLLLRKAVIITGTWESIPTVSLTGLNFQFHPLAESTSPIFKACRAGDIATMREFFQNRQASPHVINECGQDLILVSISAEQYLTIQTNSFIRLLCCHHTLLAIRPVDSFWMWVAKEQLLMIKV